MDPAPANRPLQLVFRGECLDGHDPQAVRRAVASALKLDEKQAARLFSGRRVVLRRGLDDAAAHRHIARFALMGALLRAEPSQPRPPRREPAPATAVPAGPARLGWRRLVWWTGIAVPSLVVALVLAFMVGPEPSALWPEPHPPATTGAQAIANAQPAPAAADVPAATTPPAAAAAPPATDDEVPPDMTGEALREYKLRYLSAPAHKAFAISTGGAHGWYAGAASDNEARELAVARCMAVLRPGDDGCRIADADGSPE